MKTIHGCFLFEVQRFGSGEHATTWLEHSQQVLPGQISRRLGEFGACYINRVSDEEVERLVERLTGERLLSDQTIWHQVVGQAAAISQQWLEQTPEVEPVETEAGVDWYDSQRPEVLVLSDGIQVKPQKPGRYHSDQKPAEEPKRERVRVNTDVWLVQRAGGGFQYLTAGINQAGEEIVSVEARVRHCLQEEYGAGELPLPVVAITDGAKAIRCQLETIFGRRIPVILDWYHLEKKVWEFMSSAARTKTEKEAHVSELLKLLWHGRTKEALEYLQTRVETKSEKKRWEFSKLLNLTGGGINFGFPIRPLPDHRKIYRRK